jgi:hypothetical protein
MHHVTILDTTDLVEELEAGIGYYIEPSDHLEFFQQLFQILDLHSPMDLTDRNVLTFESLIFAHRLPINRTATDKVAYRILVKLWQKLQYHKFYVNGSLMYFPFSMHGKDLCVRRYDS